MIDLLVVGLQNELAEGAAAVSVNLDEVKQTNKQTNKQLYTQQPSIFPQ